MLPLVRAIVSDLVELSQQVYDRRQHVAQLLDGREVNSKDPYSSELAQIHEELEKDERRLHDYVEELRKLEVEPKSGLDGLVDFPAEMDGRIVFLCWKLGEDEVTCWHEIDAGFAGRQSLTAESVVGDDQTERG